MKMERKMGGALIVEEGVLPQWEDRVVNDIKDIWKVHRETFYKLMQKKYTYQNS